MIWFRLCFGSKIDEKHNKIYINSICSNFCNSQLACKNGEYFVNDINIDKSLNLRYSYIIDADTFAKLMTTFNDNEDFEYYPVSKDSYLAFLDNDIVEKFTIKLERDSLNISENLFTFQI